MSRFLLPRRHLLAGMAAAGLLPRRSLGAEARRWRWAVDYGPATSPDQAQGYDLLVLEPDHSRPIAPLRGPGSRLLGYLSFGEVEQGRSYIAALRRQGVLKAVNPNWRDSRMVDMRKPAWSALVLDQLIPEVLAKGYDGIFIDTLDNVEALETRDPVANGGMIDAAVELVRAVRQRFPGIVVMMNRGYALLPRVADRIDVILAEAMASRWNFTTKAYELAPPSDWAWQAERLNRARVANPALKLATLDYWDPEDHATIAGLYERERRAGYAPYVATLALDRLYPEPLP